MIPKGAEGIGHLAAHLFTGILPRIQNEYAMADVALMASLMGLVATDYERGVQTRMTDNEEMLALFSQALPDVTDALLKNALEDALASKPESYLMSELTAYTDQNLAVLIRLHSHAEDAREAGESWGMTMNNRIWSFLERHVERHSYQVEI